MSPRILSAQVLVLSILAGCGGIERLSVQIEQDESPRRRARAARKIASLRVPESVPALIGALDDPEETVRSAIVAGLAELGSADAMEAVRQAMSDPSPVVRTRAAKGLARVGTEASGRLVQALADRHAQVRQAAAESLGGIGGTVAGIGLRQAMSDPEPAVRAAAVEALARAEGRGASAELQSALVDKEAIVRRAAARALSGLADPSASAALIKALDDEDPVTAEHAADAVIAIGSEPVAEGLRKVVERFPGPHRVDAFKRLASLAPKGAAGRILPGLLESVREVDRGLAARALGVGRHEAAGEALARVLGRDPSGAVRREAAYALAAIGRPEGLDVLMRDLETGPRRADAADALALLGALALEPLERLGAEERADPGSRSAALAVIAHLGETRSLDTARSAAAAAEAQVRAAATLALGEIGGADALEAARPASNDPDRRVRTCAAWAMAKLGDGSKMREIELAIEADSEPEQLMAVGLLARLEGPAAVKALVKGLSSPQVNVRALSAASLGRAGLDDEAAVSGLARLARDTHAEVRSAAASALGRIAMGRSVELLMDFANDRERTVRLAAVTAAGASGKPEGLRVVARALIDQHGAVRVAALEAMSALGGQTFGLEPGRARTAAEVDAAIRRAQLWWHERSSKLD